MPQFSPKKDKGVDIGNLAFYLLLPDRVFAEVPQWNISRGKTKSLMILY